MAHCRDKNKATFYAEKRGTAYTVPQVRYQLLPYFLYKRSVSRIMSVRVLKTDGARRLSISKACSSSYPQSTLARLSRSRF